MNPLGYDVGQQMLGPMSYGGPAPYGQDPQLNQLARQLAMQAPPPMGGLQDIMRQFGGLQVQDQQKAPYHLGHPIGLGAGQQFANTIPALNQMAGQTRGNVSLGDYLSRAGGR